MKRLALVTLLLALALAGCASVRGTWLDFNCWFGTRQEEPCWCHDSEWAGHCPPEPDGGVRAE